MSELTIFSFRISGLEDNHASRRNYAVPYEETFDIEAEDVGDALNTLVNRSGMWETLDMDSGFKIEFVPEELPKNVRQASALMAAYESQDAE